jgi:hypothetical protein
MPRVANMGCAHEQGGLYDNKAKTSFGMVISHNMQVKNPQHVCHTSTS